MVHISGYMTVNIGDCCFGCEEEREANLFD